MWEQVELRELRTFLVVAEERHFGRSAARLLVTQSRVSQTVRELEVKLGEVLFERTSRRVELSQAGAELLSDLRSPLGQLASVLERADRDDRELVGLLRLRLFYPAAGGPRLTEIIEIFQDRHPECPVDVSVTVDWSDVLGPLIRGEADLMAARLPVSHPELTVGPVLGRNGRVVAVAEDHPLAGRDEVTLEDLVPYAVARFDTDLQDMVSDLIPARTPKGRPIRRNNSIPPPRNFAELFMNVARGELVHPTESAVADYVTLQGVTFVPLVGMAPVETALVWRRASRDPRIRAFADTAGQVIAA